MDRLQSMEVFVKVAQAGSFSAAASQLGMSKSTVSKHIVALEERLGVLLINRTTRRLSLTEVGEAYCDCCLKIVQEIEEAELSTIGLNAEPRGTLKISAPMSFGILYLSPLIPQFVNLWPKIDFDLNLNDRRVDILDEGYDLAIRIGPLEDSSLIARKLSESQMMAVASPGYLKRHGTPQHPEELVDHVCLTYAYGRMRDSWRFKGPDGPVQVRVESGFHVNNGDAMEVVARGGVGIALLPAFIVHQSIKSGELVRILQDFDLGCDPVSAVYPHNRHVSAKVRTFVEFLVEQFRRDVPWQTPDAKASPIH